jgi:hypothetical protein
VNAEIITHAWASRRPRLISTNPVSNKTPARAFNEAFTAGSRATQSGMVLVQSIFKRCAVEVI